MNSSRQASILHSIRVESRPERPKALYAVSTFTWRSLRKTMLMLPYLSIDILIFPAVFLLIFTYLLGGAISGSTGSYLQFLLPGMLIYTVTSMTVYIGISIKTDMDRGVFNRFRTLPFWQPAAIIGTMLVNILTFAGALLTTILIGYLLGFRAEAGIIGVVLTILLAITYAFRDQFDFACIGVMAKKSESITTLSYIVIYPLMFTSNVFADTSTMPDWLGNIVSYNPVSLASTAARGLMHGTATYADLLTAFGVLLICILIFMPLTFHLYRKKAMS